MARGENTALHAGRQVQAGRFQSSVVTPTPDGGASSDTAGPIIQANWERLRDEGMSAEDATERLHTLTPTVAPVPTAEAGSTPWWVSPQRVAPNNATMSGPTIPADVRAPDAPSADGGGVGGYAHDFFNPGPLTVRTNSYGPAGDFMNRYVVDQA